MYPEKSKVWNRATFVEPKTLNILAQPDCCLAKFLILINSSEEFKIVEYHTLPRAETSITTSIIIGKHLV